MPAGATRVMGAMFATVLFTVSMLFSWSSPVGAQTLAIVNAEVYLGTIYAYWLGAESIDDSHLTMDGWMIPGALNTVDTLAHVDLFTAGTHIVTLLGAFTLSNTGCTVVFHGPSLADFVGDNYYHAFYEEDDLGGVLYLLCDLTLISIILSMITSYGVLILYEITHV